MDTLINYANCSSVLNPGAKALGQTIDPVDPTRVPVFAGGDLSLVSFNTISGGATTAMGNVTHTGGTANLDSLIAAGSFNGTDAFEDILGDITLGGDIIDLGGPGSTVGGNLRSGGSVTLMSSINVAGHTTVTGNFTQPFTFAVNQGNVTAGGNVTIEGTVGGHVTHGGFVQVGTFGSVGSASVGGSVAPPPITAMPLPAPHAIHSVGADINLAAFQDIALSPGNHGVLSFASGNTVSLTSGRYVFDDIVSTFSLNELSFDTTAGPIEILIEGDFAFKDLVQVINGEALFTGGNPDPADAADIYFEATGSVTVNEKLYGTVYAPQGDITTDTFADVTGALIASGNVILGSSADVTFVRSRVVPEPSGLAAAGLLGLALIRRRGA